jgi:ribosomal-protein-alanine N-acetyltransferase
MVAHMTLSIETASTYHLDELYEIEKQCFSKEAFTKRQIAYLLADYNSLSLVAKENGKIVGFIIGVVNNDGSSLIAHILTIDVLLGHRRRGIGLKLLQEIERIFKERNVETCFLEVREDNIKASRLYQRLGYEPIRSLKNYYGDANGLQLRKDLT